MSRLAKKPIIIPSGVEVFVSEGVLRVKGPLGELTRAFPSALTLSVSDGAVSLALANFSAAKPLLGTYTAHLKNMIFGASKGFEKSLLVEGTGYRARVSGDTLTLSLGFSHEVLMKIPAGLKVAVKENEIIISGTDKELIGQFAADVRSKRPPEPYKGKGVRYKDEVIIRKQGKKAVA